uniref:Transmembrane protein n=1 Tax=Heterorhabditis bacteriophora TaxID=37862 RepID=A0A1I7WKX4_HETBA
MNKIQPLLGSYLYFIREATEEEREQYYDVKCIENNFKQAKAIIVSGGMFQTIVFMIIIHSNYFICLKQLNYIDFIIIFSSKIQFYIIIIVSVVVLNIIFVKFCIIRPFEYSNLLLQNLNFCQSMYFDLCK